MQKKVDTASERWLNLHEVCELAQIRKTTLYQKVNDGKFPAPVIFSARKRLWAASWVEAHIGAMIDEAARHNAKLIQRRRARRNRRSA